MKTFFQPPILFLFVILGSSMMLSCNNDLLDPDRDCEEIDIPREEREEKRQNIEFSGASFNPNNSDEIAYLRRDNSDPENPVYEIWKYDMDTGQALQLHPQARADQWVKWSVKDQILFLNNDPHVWSVNSDGTQATPMTYENTFHNFPEWHPSGDSFIVYTNRPPNNDPIYNNKFYLFSANNTYYEPFDDNFRHDKLRFSPSGRFIAGESFTPSLIHVDLVVKDLVTQQVIYDDSLEGETIYYAYGHSWFPDEQRLVWCTIRTLYIVNVFTKDFSIIKEFCDSGSRVYRYPSVSRDGEKILLTREDSKRIGGKNSTRVLIATSIVMMNVDGSGEEVIALRE